MLTDSQIKDYVRIGKITISPYDERAVGSGNYQVRLGPLLLIPKAGQIVDLKNPDPQFECTEVHMDTATGFVLEPNMFVLGQTLEKLAMDDDIGMLIDGRSTLARLGMSIHQSSMTLLPGQEDHVVTLEIFNAGTMKLRIYPEMRIGKLIMFQSSEKNSTPYRLYGQYAGQQQTTAARL